MPRLTTSRARAHLLANKNIQMSQPSAVEIVASNERRMKNQREFVPTSFEKCDDNYVIGQIRPNLKKEVD